MSVPYTSYRRSIALDEASARAIAAQTSLFGYTPDVVPVGGDWYLSICSEGDAETVKTALAALNQRRATQRPPKVQPIKVEARHADGGRSAGVWGLFPFGDGHEWDLIQSGFTSLAEANEHINSVYEGIA